MFQLQLRDNDDALVAYIDNKIKSISWEWDRIGGCGACNLSLKAPFDGSLIGSIGEDYSLRAYVDGTLWYSGFIDKITPNTTGKEETTNILALGYVNQLKRIVIKEKTYTNSELTTIVKDIINTHVMPNTNVISYSNLPNGSFEAWNSGTTSAPDGYNLSNGAVAREGTIVKLDSYSAKLTRSGTNCYIRRTFSSDKGISYWQGKTVTLSGWVYTTVAWRGVLYIQDDSGVSRSSFHSGVAGWEYLTVTKTLSGSATFAICGIELQGGDTSIYADGLMLVEGSADIEYYNNYDDSKFTADSIYFNENAFDCITKLANIAGKREWGVRADKSFFFKARDDSTQHFFNLKQDFESFKPIKDYNPMVTKIYLEGSEGYKEQFAIVNRVAQREEILSNSAITTQSVGYQYARMYLKEHGIVRRSYIGKQINRTTRLEATIPMGRALLATKIGVQYLYDVAAQLYDSGLKYDGGNEYLQIEKIKYELADEGINATLYLGPLPPSLTDKLARLEYEINTERIKT